LLASRPAAAAGEITLSKDDGWLITDRTGHYESTPYMMAQFIAVLAKQNFDLRNVTVFINNVGIRLDADFINQSLQREQRMQPAANDRAY
jgi:hypothetical protein